MINVSNQKKYEILESDFIDYENKKLYRIVSKISDSELRIKEGDLGGYIEGYHNLSQEGRCWIYFGSIACGESEVLDNAILGNPDMLEISELLYDSPIDRATCGVILKESSKVMGNSIIDTVNCEISGTTKIHGGVYLINEELISDRNRYKYCKSINISDELLKRFFPRFFDDNSNSLTEHPRRRVSYNNKRVKIFDKDVSKVLILGNSEIGDPELDGTGYSSTLKSAVENDSFVLISGKSVIIDNCTIKGKVSIEGSVLVDSEILGENKGILYNKMSHIAINKALPKKKKYITELKKGINNISRGAIKGISYSYLMLYDDEKKMIDRTDETLNISTFNLSEGLSKLLNTYYEDSRLAKKESTKKDDIEDFLFSELYSNDSQSSFVFRVTGYINSTMGVKISMHDLNTKQEIELLYDFLKSLKKCSNADRLIKACTKKLGERADSTSFKYNEISTYLLMAVFRNISSNYANYLSVELDDKLIHKAIELAFKRSQNYYSRYDNDGNFLFPAIVLNSSIKGNNIHLDPGYYEGMMVIDSTITGSVMLFRSIVIRSKVGCNTESVYVNSSVPGYKRNNYKPNICGDYWGEPLNRLCNLIGDSDYASPLDIYADVVMDSSQICQISIVNDDDESEVTEVYNYVFESIVLDSELVGAMYISYSVVHESDIYSNGKIKYFCELFDKLRKEYANKDENEKKSNVIKDILIFHGRNAHDYVSSTFLDTDLVNDTYSTSDRFAYESRTVIKNSVVIDSNVVDSSIVSVILKESKLNHTYLSARLGHYYGASSMRINKSTINDTLLYSGKGLYQIPVGYSSSNFYGKGIIIDINDSNISNSKICICSTIPANDKYRKFIFTTINSSIHNSILQLTGGKPLEDNELDQCHYYKESKELGMLEFINRNKAYMNMAFNLIDRNIINLNKQYISSRNIDSKVRLKGNGSAKFSADIIKDVILSRKLKRKESLEELLNITRKEANNG